MLNPATLQGAAILDHMVNQQAQIIAYNNDFRMASLVVLPLAGLLLLMRRHEPRPTVTAPSVGN